MELRGLIIQLRPSTEVASCGGTGAAKAQPDAPEGDGWPAVREPTPRAGDFFPEGISRARGVGRTKTTRGAGAYHCHSEMPCTNHVAGEYYLRNIL